MTSASKACLEKFSYNLYELFVFCYRIFRCLIIKILSIIYLITVIIYIAISYGRNFFAYILSPFMDNDESIRCVKFYLAICRTQHVSFTNENFTNEIIISFAHFMLE